MNVTDIRNALEARYPEADFNGYFAFLSSVPAHKKRSGLHWHHIAPKKQFPELANKKSNFILLTLKEHKQAHKILYQQCPEMGWPSPNFINGAEKAGRKGGRIGGRVNATYRTGVCGLTLKQHQAAGSIGGRISWPARLKKGTAFGGVEGRAKGRRKGNREQAANSINRRISAAPNASVARAQRITDKDKRWEALQRLGYCGYHWGVCRKGPRGKIAKRWKHYSECKYHMLQWLGKL